MANKRTIQVATEAIINDPELYADDTILCVLSDARAMGVGQLYVDGVESIARGRGLEL